MAEKTRSERKIYKGEVKRVKEFKLRAPVPVQPMERTFRGYGGFQQNLPPTFIVTKFAPGFSAASRMMHYYDPSSGVKAQQDIPEDFELNLLLGKRGQELDKVWEDKVKTSLSSVSRRLTCTIGADPELFVVDKDNAVVPAWSFLKGKKDPNRYSVDEHKGEVYWDGFQAEFTTPGLTCLMQMAVALRGGLKEVNTRKPAGSRLSLASVLPVAPKTLATAEDEHVAFGCAPSKNLYNLKGNTQDGRMVPYRFAGGHIHMGLDDDQKKRIPEMVRGLDTILAVACVSLFASFDNPLRRKFYGQAGEYRTPHHGLEYRVLSNAWLAHPVVFHMVFDLARAVAGFVDEGHPLSLWNASEDETLKAIQDSDVDLARAILVRNRPMFTQLLYTANPYYGRGPYSDFAWTTWAEGMEKLVSEPDNIEKNWGVGVGQYWKSPTYFGQVTKLGI